MKVKILKILKVLGLFFLFGSIYIIAGFILVSLAFRFALVSFDEMYSLSATYLLVFFSIYFSIYEKAKRFKFFWRILLYFIFVLSMAPFLFAWFNLILPYSHFLRFRGSLGRSVDSLEYALDGVAFAIFIGFIFLNILIELKRINNLIKPFFYWLISVLLGWYLSIPALILYTGFNYQGECIWSDWNKSPNVPESCYTIGEPIYQSWEIFSGILVLISQIIFIIFYFHKYNNKDINNKKPPTCGRRSKFLED